MTIYHYEIDPQRYAGGVNSVLIEPGPTPTKDDNTLDPYFEGEYWQPIHLGGSDKDNRPLGPWVLRFDDSVPYEADAHAKLLARMKTTDRRGRPVMDYIRPYQKTVTLTEADIESEVQRRMAARIAALNAAGPAAPPEDRVNPPGITVIEATEDIDAPPPDDAGEEELPPTQRRCRACGQVKDKRGYKGHLIFMIDNGQMVMEHSRELAAFNVEKDIQRQAAAV